MKYKFFPATIKVAVYFIFAMMSNLAVAQVTYVTPAGAGLMDGSSWANALDGNTADTGGFTRLASAVNNAIPGTCFWIAEGTYKVCHDNDRAKSFRLGQNIRLYGGFEGNETDTLQRNISLHQTIFSGDIGVAGDSTDNSKTILNTKPDTWTNYSFIDGLTFRDGFNSDWNTPGVGLVNYGLLRVSSCYFTSNNGMGDGGGILNGGVIRVENCRFYRNSAFWGGGIFNAWYGTAMVLSSRFYNNSGYLDGGAIQNSGNLTLVNSLVANNSGGGICGNSNVNMYGINLKIINSTIVNNAGYANLVFYYGHLTILNSIVWGGGLLLAYNPVTDFRHSIIQDYTGNPLVYSFNPSFSNPSQGTGAGYNGMEADWSLTSCSQAINLGADSLVPAGTLTDIDGQPRIRYTAVDLGAWETDTTGLSLNVGFGNSRIYVSENWQYIGNGSSWNTALAGNAESCNYPGQTLLYEAMRNATPGTEIWLQAGTYRCSRINDRSHAFTVAPGVKVYGGFGGDETDLNQRNPHLHPVILSGNTGLPNVETDNSYHVMDINPGLIAYPDSALVSDITIREGYAGNPEDGAGIRIRSHAKVRLDHVEITGNKTQYLAAGLMVDSLARVKCTLSRIAENSGYGICNRGTLALDSVVVKLNNNAGGLSGIFNSDTLTLNRCSVDSNFNTYPGPASSGGGLVNQGYCRISGGSFTRNMAFVMAGGIWNKQAGDLEIDHCLFTDNRCDIYQGGTGGAIYNEGALKIRFGQISGNTAACDASAIFNGGGANCSVFHTPIVSNTVNGSLWSTATASVLNFGIMNIDGSLVANNNGMGLYHPTQVKNCLIVNNTEGISAANGCTGIFNTTVAHNLATGISSSASQPVPLMNNIVYENGTNLSGTFEASHTCTLQVFAGNGNIIGKPYWVEPSSGKGPAFNGVEADWNLQPYSPSANSGDNGTLLNSDTLDAYGQPRIMFNTVDMGGAELQQPALGLPPVVDSPTWEVFRPKASNIELTTAEPWQSISIDSLLTALPYDQTTQSRIRGYLVPPIDGYYRFYMASDIGGYFYLSTDSTEYKKRLICQNPEGNSSWPDSLAVTDSVYMQAGIPCYFESFCRQHNYDYLNPPQNYMRIGWTFPGNNRLHLIKGEYLRKAKPKQDLTVDWELFKNRTTYDFGDLKNTTIVPDEVVKLDSISTVDRSTRMDFFSSRIRGCLIPPVSGNYEFYFACDNVGQFWLSTDSTVLNAGLKSEIFSADVDWYQHISTQELIAGQKYYFEILQYDTAFTDLVKLGWKIPGESQPVVLKSPWITSCHDIKPAVKLQLTDSIVQLYPGVNKTPKFYMTPWNTDFKGISWTSRMDAVATVDCYGKITAVAPGSCRIVASLTSYPAVRDSLDVIVSDYLGPFYVRENATVNGSGQSWDDPVGLAKLLEFLSQGPLPGQVTVYVGEGVYKPTETIDRNKTFSLNKIRLSGGYSNQSTGTDTTLRSVNDHETILSGEIGQPGETIDNSYHVVLASGEVMLDGLTIRDGRASCSTYGSIPGFYTFKQDDNGGGVFVTGPDNVISNCRILHNSAWNRGGGIYANGGMVQMDSDELAENLIQQEAITNWGIFIIYINGNGAGIATGNSTVNATNCIFHHNGPTVGMGSVAFINLGSSGTFTRCSFYSNTGIPADVSATNGSSLNLSNSTVMGSVGFSLSGGNVCNTTILGPVMNLVNPYSNSSISIDNSFATSVDSSVFNAANTTVRYSIIGSNLYGENKETLISDTVQPSNIWLDTLAYNGGITPTMRLKNIPGNPAKTHGNVAYLGTPDQRGITRNDTVSIGAYQWVWPSQITINPQQASIAPGDSLPFTVTVLPTWADDKTWSASASDSQIVGIAGNTMLAQSEGNARVMVRTSDGNRRDTCFVMVMTDSVGVNGIVHNGNFSCYSALGVITVAGSGTSFVMQPGSNSVMIAGEKIFYLPGTTVKAGGFMHGYIAPQGPWCNDYKSSEDIVQMREIDPQGTAISTGMEFVKVWPNPTTGMLYLAINPRDLITPVQATIFSFLGEVVFQDSYMGKTTTSISLESLPPGMYLLQLVQGDKRESVKLIKQ